MQNRRHFLKTGFSIATAGLAGAAALTRARRSLADEAPPETTSVRLLYWKDGATCLAPIQILDDLLRDEGFADVRYVPGADSDVTNRNRLEHWIPPHAWVIRGRERRRESLTGTIRACSTRFGRCNRGAGPSSGLL